jgi:hypothetical protein
MVGVAEGESVASARRWLPMLPSPFLDETFGSWWHRAADAYHTTERELACAIVALDQRELARGEIDWDTAPPTELLGALAAHSPFRADELRHLIVAPGPATLAPWQRDAYCPECLEQDRRDGAIYIRRSWLDAWTLRCETHACLLGALSLYEYAQPASVQRSGGYAVFDLALPLEPLRIDPSVAPFVVPTLGCAAPSHLVDADGIAQSWLPPAMLNSVVGRDLVLFMGSSEADVLYYRLLGRTRHRKEVWHDGDHRALPLTDVDHPHAPIAVRLEAAYLASLIWRCLFPGDADVPPDGAALIALLRQGMRSCARSIEGRMCRWPRSVRRRWTELFE